jgi:hypothetical protein
MLGFAQYRLGALREAEAALRASLREQPSVLGFHLLAKVAVPVFKVDSPASVADIVKLFAEINGPGVVSLPVITVAPRATLSRISNENLSGTAAGSPA